jgi:2-iminobutanoate/2-iminopropanoate deaminase
MKTVIYAVLAILFFFGINACSDRKDKFSDRVSSEAARSEKQDSIIFHKSHEPEKQNLPFSDIVEAGRFYFLSGQIGMDHTTRKLVPGGITAETKQTLENIKAVLEYHQLDLSRVVKVTVILDNMDDFPAFNEVYVNYFPQKPARTTFAAETLARGAKIEIDVVAVSDR